LALVEVADGLAAVVEGTDGLAAVVEGTGLAVVEGTGLAVVEGTGLAVVEGTGLAVVEGTGLAVVDFAADPVVRDTGSGIGAGVGAGVGVEIGEPGTESVFKKLATPSPKLLFRIFPETSHIIIPPKVLPYSARTAVEIV